MAYRVPKRAIGSGEPADPSLLDENLRPPASELSGRLNEHNVQSGSISSSLVPTTTYYVPYYTTAPASYIIEGDGESTAYVYYVEGVLIPDDGAWHALDDISITLTTGEDLLWLVGWLTAESNADTTYIPDGEGFTPISGDYQSTRYRRPRLQAAIRVDGVVLQETVTGTMEIISQPPWGLFPSTPVSDKVSIHPFKTAGCASLAKEDITVRMQAHVPVQAGSHTVELVVRRVPPDVSPDEATNYDPGADNRSVFVYGRRLLAMQIIHNAAATGSDAQVNVDDHEDQDVMSAASVATGGLTPLATRANDLTDGTIIRHGLRQVHLPSRILYPCQVGLNTGGRDPDGTVTDGGGTPLRTTNGPYDFATNPAFVVIMANVHVGIDNAQAYLHLRLTSGADYYDSTFSSPTPLPTDPLPYPIGGIGSGSEARNYDDAGGGASYAARANYDVPLFLCLDYRTDPPAADLDYVDVIVNAPPTVLRSNLLLLAFG